MSGEDIRWYQYRDPADHVEFDWESLEKKKHGCAVCIYRPREGTERCQLKQKPFAGTVYCNSFDLEAR